MSLKALPVFTKDRRTGLVEELAPRQRKTRALLQDDNNDSHPRVLVANDDDTDRRNTILRLWQAWPSECDLMVESAADKAEAMEKVRRRQYALVVLDLNMPPQNAGDAVSAMRKDDLRVPIVVVSVQYRPAIARHLKALSATFVHKHQLDPSTLRKAITRSILLQEGVFGLVRFGFDLHSNVRRNISTGRSRPLS